MAYDTLQTFFRISSQEGATTSSAPLSLNTGVPAFTNPSIDFIMGATTAVATPVAAMASAEVTMTRLQFSAAAITSPLIPLSGNGAWMLVCDDPNYASAGVCLTVAVATSGVGNILGTTLPSTTSPIGLSGLYPSFGPGSTVNVVVFSGGNGVSFGFVKPTSTTTPFSATLITY